MIRYFINGEPVDVEIDNATEAAFGAPGRLSTPETDITATQSWYDQGFTVADLFSDTEFATFRAAIEASLRSALTELGRDTRGFTLERYHHFVDDAAHAAVVERTRALFQHQLAVNIATLQDRLGRLLGHALTDSLSDIVPRPADAMPSGGTVSVPAPTGSLPVIIRVNRPCSGDFNPVHKDIYEAVDHLGQVPRLVNFWIPVAGVGSQSALPLAPGSHLLDESVILRTRAGSVVGGRRYRVNSILEWDGGRSLERARLRDGQVLVFSSHLIHGLAINAQPDTTRVAVEFRLGPVQSSAKPVTQDRQPG